MQIITRALSCLIVLAELIMSSCATSINLDTKYDDIYYAPSDKQFAQNIDTTKYSYNKAKYDYRNYKYQAGDKYKPVVAGIASYFLPGLGQMYSGEKKRGTGFLLGYLSFGTLFSIGFIEVMADATTDIVTHDRYVVRGGGLVLAGLIGMIPIDLWSVIDAVQVAKVNDLVIRNKHNTLMNLHINPYLSPANCSAAGKLYPGISLKLTF